jgi:hypothetical protein
MSWMNALASGLGVPAGAATLAVAMYAACAAAEKAARPEALKDMARILRDPSSLGSIRPSAIIEQIFWLTFGSRHFSIKCAARSAATTAIMAVAVLISLFVETGIAPYIPYGAASWQDALPIALMFVFGAAATFAALGKTRLLFVLLDNQRLYLLLMLLDVALSFLIAVWVFVASGVVFSKSDLWGRDAYFSVLKFADNPVFVPRTLPSFLAIYISILASTILTAIWTILLPVSAGILKLLHPIQNFALWYFDIDKHPLQALGIMSAVIVMLTSLVWSVLQAVSY